MTDDRHHSAFPLGRIVATPGVQEALAASHQVPGQFLARHVQGDWGDVCDADRRENAYSLRKGFRLLSVYTTRRGQKIWIITEADRSATTLLLPEEY